MKIKINHNVILGKFPTKLAKRLCNSWLHPEGWDVTQRVKLSDTGPGQGGRLVCRFDCHVRHNKNAPYLDVLGDDHRDDTDRKS